MCVFPAFSVETIAIAHWIGSRAREDVRSATSCVGCRLDTRLTAGDCSEAALGLEQRDYMCIARLF